MDKTIDTNLLQVLIALSENESISKAAEELNVTQSAVSQSLKNLESKLAIPILHRHGKSVTLTENGKKIAKVAKSYFKRIDETIDQIHQESGKLQGVIHVGTLSGLGKSWISKAMIHFLAKYPDLDVKISMDFPENLIKSFDKGEIDVLILPQYLIPPWAQSMELHDEYSTLVYPDHPNFPITDETELKEIIHYPVLMFEPHDPLFYRWIKERFKATPKPFKSKLVVNSFSQILHGVQEGLGIAVVPTHVLKNEDFQYKVKKLSSKSEVHNNKIFYAALAEESEHLKIKTLYKFMVDYLKNTATLS